MSTATISALALASAGNFDDTAVFPIDDKNGNTRRVTTAMVRTQINSADQLFPDGLYDLGKVGATRLRDGFFSRHVTVGGTLTMTTAVSKLVPGATSFSVRNNADGADNLLIANDGTITVRNRVKMGTNVTEYGSGHEIVRIDNDAIEYRAGGVRCMYLAFNTAYFPSLGTTASAANAFLDSADGNKLYRSTSSLRYKKDVVPYSLEAARAVVLRSEGKLFVSTSEGDNPDRHFVGFAAEELWGDGKWEGKRYVHLTKEMVGKDVFTTDKRTGRRVQLEKARWTGRMIPDGVAYASFVVPHNLMLKDHESRLQALEESLLNHL
jgi:hypothetical protein